MQKVKLSRLAQTREIEIPDDWELKQINQIGKVDEEYVDEKKYNHTKIKYIDIGSISDLKIKNPEEISFGERPSRAQKIVRLNDVIISTVRPYNKGFAMIESNEENQICSTGFTTIRAEEIEAKWIFYNSQTEFFNIEMIRLMQGSNYPAVTSTMVGNTLIPFPKDSKIREKIISILSNIDNLLEKQKQKIEETQNLKRGIMQKLLYQGLNHETEKFQKIKTRYHDEIKIPEKWEYKPLGKVVEILSGEYFRFEEFEESGVPVLKIDNVMHGKIEWETVSYLSKNYANSFSELFLHEGDIVLALNRPITHNQVKVGMITKQDVPSILYQRVGKFIFVDKDFDHQFFYQFLKGIFFKKLLSRILIGSDQPYVKTTELLRQEFPFPKDPKEQEDIGNILKNLDSLIEKEIQTSEYLNEVKRGLLRQLLTGEKKIRNEL